MERNSETQTSNGEFCFCLGVLCFVLKPGLFVLSV